MLNTYPIDELVAKYGPKFMDFTLDEDGVTAYVFTNERNDKYIVWARGIPVTYNGEPVTKEHLKYYEERAKKSAESFGFTFTGETVELEGGFEFKPDIVVDNVVDNTLSIALGQADTFDFAMKISSGLN